MLIRTCSVAVLVLWLVAAPSGAEARVIHVTTLELAGPPSVCRLDEAILNANDDTENYLCEPGEGDDVIRFEVQGTIELDEELPSITDTLAIEGPGADLLTISGSGLTRVLSVAPGVSLTLSGVTIAGALAPAGAPGGGLQVLAGADVTLQDCVFSGNAAASGGAVSITQGALRVERCTFVGNDATAGATGAGGAIRNDRSQVEIVNSTFSDNTSGAGRGAAVATLGAGATTRIHSTSVIGNGTTGAGGALERDADASVFLTHTLLAAAAAGLHCGVPTPTSEGYNLADDTSCGLVGAGDVQGVASAGVEPLANNGGPSETHALVPGSVAIDAGDSSCFDTDQTTLLATDQRGVGFPRRTDGDGMLGARCDIGAFEVPEPASGAGATVAALTLAALVRRRGRRAGPRPAR
ncbi:hypothetical protein KJ059_02955 [Myxococcota bacterium]|nr:hypothetical protein [Myxococcota bacterium]